jgi:hypothetical protein
MASGLVIAGVAAAAVARRSGWRATQAAAIGLIAGAVVGLAAAPAIGITLAASLALGVGTGVVLGFANAELAAPGGSRSRLRLARANVWAMVSAFAAPVIIATSVRAGGAWWIGLMPAIGLLALVAVDLRADRAHPTSTPADAGGPLPRAFWLAWVFVVGVVALEFSIVVWASTLVAQRTGLAAADATLAGAAFLAGMFLGRLALAVGLGTGGDARRPAGLGLLLAATGAVVVWLSTIPPLSVVALLVAGVGVATLYPLGIAIAIGASGGRLAAAGARLTLASGLAILIAPLALGAHADAAGVVTGWALVPGLAVAALALTPRLPSGSVAA